MLPLPNIVKSLIAFVILLQAFTKGRRWQKAGYLLVASLLLGGMFTALQTYATTNLHYFIGVAIVIVISLSIFIQFIRRLTLQQLLRRYEVSCELVFDRYKLTCQGFIDTGNQSIEPFSGRAIHFASIELLNVDPQLQSAFLLWDDKKPDDVSMFPQHLQQQFTPIYVTTIDGKSLVLALNCTVVIEQRPLSEQYVVFVQQTFQFRQQVHVILNASVIQTIKGDRYCYEA